jgi:shikimate dehydrogenase
MTVVVSASTRVITLLGDPVEYSFSPVLQNAAFAAAGVDGVYVAVRCSVHDLPGLIGALGRTGGAGNITLPHKEKAAAVVDVRSEAVRRTGACNTFWGQDGQIHGDNTDVEGFRRALRTFLHGPPAGFRVLLIGAGGAARAVMVGLMDDDISEVVIANRTVERARAMARRIGGERARVADTPAAIDDGDFDLVLNATRLGLEPADPLPLDLERLSRAGAVMDLVYGREPSPFLKEAERLGIRRTDGGEMLVQQGAVAFERWWGEPGPVAAMRQALDSLRGA